MTAATAVSVSEFGQDRDSVGTVPRVAGFPVEGAWVQVHSEDGGAIVRGWLSVDPVFAGVEDVNVAVVTVGTAPTGETTIGVWTGRVTPERVTPGTEDAPSAPLWFAGFVDVVHARTRIAGNLEAVGRERAQLAELVRDTEQRHESRITELAEDACEFADRHNLCSEFDRFMEDHGLSGRVRDREVGVTVTAHLTITVSARSQTGAEDAVDEDDVRAAIRDQGPYLSFDYGVDRTED